MIAGRGLLCFSLVRRGQCVSNMGCFCSSLIEGKKRISRLGSRYPFDTLHNDRVHGPFDMMMEFGREGPVVRVVFDVGFCLGRHD